MVGKLKQKVCAELTRVCFHESVGRRYPLVLIILRIHRLMNVFLARSLESQIWKINHVDMFGKQAQALGPNISQ